MKKARKPDKEYVRRLPGGGAGHPRSDRFEIPGYNGPMAALLDIIRFGPAILGVPRTLVLLFIAECTVAYRKLADAPSLTQIVEGAYSKQGIAVQWVRMGCGLKHSAAVEATASLVEMGLLEKRKRSDAKRGNLPTQYEIRWDALQSYLIEKSDIRRPPLIRSAEKGSSKPLQTALSETPLSAQRTSPCPPGGQEQYLDYYSATKSTLAGKSAFNGVLLNESKTSKADYSFASAKPAEDSEHVRSLQARKPTSKPTDPDSEQVHEVSAQEPSVESQEQPPTSMPDPERLGRGKPWTAYELQRVRDCGSVYMEGDTPPDNFPSNCELAADGHTAAEVIEYLRSKFDKKRYRPGRESGPASWNWFYTVLRERFSASERGHLPEQPAVRHPAHQATAEEMDSGYDVLDSLDPALAEQRS
jgi:hypothetical protein